MSPPSTGQRQARGSAMMRQAHGRIVVTAAQPPRHTPAPDAERMLTMDLTSDRAQVRGTQLNFLFSSN
jgi:hypothetical protein